MTGLLWIALGGGLVAICLALWALVLGAEERAYERRAAATDAHYTALARARGIPEDTIRAWARP